MRVCVRECICLRQPWLRACESARARGCLHPTPSYTVAPSKRVRVSLCVRLSDSQLYRGAEHSRLDIRVGEHSRVHARDRGVEGRRSCRDSAVEMSQVSAHFQHVFRTDFYSTPHQQARKRSRRWRRAPTAALHWSPRGAAAFSVWHVDLARARNHNSRSIHPPRWWFAT